MSSRIKDALYPRATAILGDMGFRECDTWVISGPVSSGNAIVKLGRRYNAVTWLWNTRDDGGLDYHVSRNIDAEYRCSVRSRANPGALYPGNLHSLVRLSQNISHVRKEKGEKNRGNIRIEKYPDQRVTRIKRSLMRHV